MGKLVPDGRTFTKEQFMGRLSVVTLVLGTHGVRAGAPTPSLPNNPHYQSEPRSPNPKSLDPKVITEDRVQTHGVIKCASCVSPYGQMLWSFLLVVAMHHADRAFQSPHGATCCAFR